VSILQTDGKHKAQRPRFIEIGTLPPGSSYAGTGDMNGDLSGDVVFVAQGGYLKYWKRDGFSVLSTATIDRLPTGFEAVAVADVDGDRKDDVVLQNMMDPTLVRVWHIDGGAVAESDEYELPEGEWVIYTGNFRAKDKVDILARDRETGEVKVIVAADGAAPTFPTIAWRPAGVRIAGFGDFNGDSQQDIVWQSGNIEIDLVKKDDAGEYALLARRRTGLAPADIVNVQDWNGDGSLDFWMRRGSRNYIQYGKIVRGWVYGAGSRDLGEIRGTVVGVAKR
jgi:hypothetical protein